jgi:ABC-type multidrug transport system fused ATPase/permease subunit
MQTYVIQDLAWAVTNQMRIDLTQHCLSLDMGFYKKHSAGEMIQRIDGDVAQLNGFFSDLALKLVSNLMLLMGMIVVLYYIDWRIGAIAAILIGASSLLYGPCQRAAVPHWGALFQANAEHFAFLEEWISGAEDIRTNGATNYALQRFSPLMRSLLQRARQTSITGITPHVVSQVIFLVTTIVAALTGAYLYRLSVITIGTVYIIFAYTRQLLGPMREVMSQIQGLQQASAAIIRIQELFQTAPEVQNGPVERLSDGPPVIEFDHVSFGYDDNDSVLCNITFRLQPGHVLGLVGRTGSGKTTLTRLLFRLYDTRRGYIRINGEDIRNLHLVELRRRVGLVTQDVQLFNATVRDNLTFFDRSISDTKILNVIHDLGLSRWYQSLSAGLETELLPGGNLSAGEGQLLALARVFLKDPDLVILDEASSRLDPATESIMQRAVDKLLINRTGIIIAHRLVTVQRADEIMVLEQGRIREHGPRRQLAADPQSCFYRLLQAGGEEVA